MNPSSLGTDISAVERQKDMYKWFGSELFDDEGSPACPDLSGSIIENIISARQQVTGS